MVETENIKPTESQARASRAREKREVTLRRSRRIVLARRLFLPVLGTFLLVVFILVGREWTNKQEYLNGIQDLQKKIEAFEKEKGRLPYPGEILQFDLTSRIKAEGIRYEAEFILDDSPAESPLAYTGLLQLRFFTSGHAVLAKSGKVDWLTSTELEELIKRRNQHYRYRHSEQTPLIYK